MPVASPASTTPVAPLRVVKDKDGNTVEVAPVTLRRTGQLVVLDVLVRNVTPAGSGTPDVNAAFVVFNGQARFGGALLIDTRHRKRHAVVEDAEGRCVCTGFVGGLSVPRGAGAVLTAYFAAPPADVTTMDVVVPKVGSFAAVPLTS